MATLPPGTPGTPGTIRTAGPPRAARWAIVAAAVVVTVGVLAGAPGAAPARPVAQRSFTAHCRAGQIDRGGRCTSLAQARRRILAITRRVKREHGSER